MKLLGALLAVGPRVWFLRQENYMVQEAWYASSWAHPQERKGTARSKSLSCTPIPPQSDVCMQLHLMRCRTINVTGCETNSCCVPLSFRHYGVAAACIAHRHEASKEIVICQKIKGPAILAVGLGRPYDSRDGATTTITKGTPLACENLLRGVLSAGPPD